MVETSQSVGGVEIEFIQYLRPNGRKRPITISVSPEVANLCNGLRGVGCYFEAEVLTTGEVSLTVGRGGEDLHQEILPNGPGVQEGVERLIRRAHEDLARGPLAGPEEVYDECAWDFCCHWMDDWWDDH